MSDRSSHDIEQQLDRDRATLAQSLSRLRDHLSPAALAAQGRTALAAQYGPLLAKADAAICARPVAAAVAGVALVALILGRRRGEADPCAAPALAGTRFEALSRWEDEGGPAFDPPDPEETWLVEARGLRARATALLATIDDAARRGLAPVADLASHRAAVIGALTRDTRAALGRGLESLGEAARAQAMEARERLYVGRLTLEAQTREAIQARPLAAGAAMAAAGAALACLFPPTEAEDRMMGGTRDRLVADARAGLRDEAAKASALAREIRRALEDDIDRARDAFQPRASGPVPSHGRPH